MKFPKQVKVMGVDYRIKFSDDPDIEHDENDFVYGFADYSLSLVVLHTGMSKQQTYETLVHELCHCMLYEAGNPNYDDETLIKPLGNVMYQVIKDNHLGVR